MDEMRIGLIIGGVLILVAIYLWELRANRQRQMLDGESADRTQEPQISSIKRTLVTPNSIGSKQEYLVLYVNSPAGRFKGADIRISLSTQGLHYNSESAIYEYPNEHGGNEAAGSMFSVMNMVNPGIFPDEKLTDFATVGLAFLMVLPVRENAQKAFAKMLQVANQVAGQLHGRLLDRDHGVLTKQGISFMREKVLSSTYQDKYARRRSL